MSLAKTSAGRQQESLIWNNFWLQRTGGHCWCSTGKEC